MGTDNIKLSESPVITKIETTEEKKLKISWGKVKSADRYAVLRRDEKDGEFTVVKWMPKLDFVDEIPRDKTVWYKIKAQKELLNKKKSNKEGPIKAAILSDIPAADGLEAVSGDGEISLSWKKDEKAKKYIISRRNDFFSQMLPFAESEKAFFKDKRAVSGQVYHYCVQSVYDGDREGNFSDEVSSVILNSGKILSIKAKGKKVYLNLRISEGADGYIIERKEKDSEFSEIMRTESNLETELCDKTASHFKSYTYRVRTFKKVKDVVIYSEISESETVKTK